MESVGVSDQAPQSENALISTSKQASAHNPLDNKDCDGGVDDMKYKMASYTPAKGTIDEESGNRRDELMSFPIPQSGVIVSQQDFPRESTIAEIKEEFEWWENQVRFQQILVLGDRQSGKPNIIDAITPNHNMINNTYRFDGMSIVDEWTMYDLSPQKLKYYELFKKGLNEEDKAAVNNFGEQYRNKVLLAATRRCSTKELTIAMMKKEKEYKCELYYDKLSGLTPETLRKRTWLNYDLLPSGYIRHIQMNESFEDMVIPSGIVELIAKYFMSKIRSFRFQSGKNEKLFLKLFIPNDNTTLDDISHWTMDKGLRWMGIIYVLDVSMYNEHFVGRDGQRRNKLEYSLSNWKSIESLKTFDSNQSDGNPRYYRHEMPKLLLFTKMDLLKVKIDTIPLNVCPLFSDLDEDSSADELLSAVCNAFGVDERCYVDINDREAIIRPFHEFEIKIDQHEKAVTDEDLEDCSIM